MSAAVLAASWVSAIGADESRVRVAAASDLTFCLPALVEAFAAVHPGTRVDVSFGASGSIHAQVREGAPYDVFLSADVAYPRALVDAGLAAEDNLVPYGVGRLVLWTRDPDLDLDQGLALVATARVRRYAIANPDHAPYGVAARQSLQALGLWESTSSKRLLGENVSQAAHTVVSGNADLGIVAHALALSPRMEGQGRFVPVPAELHAPLVQAAILTRRGEANPEARRFLAFLGSAQAREVFRRFGFSLPGEDR